MRLITKQDNQDVVDLLEDMLEKARKGEILGFLAVTHEVAHKWTDWGVGSPGDWFSMAGMATHLQRRCLDYLAREED